MVDLEGRVGGGRGVRRSKGGMADGGWGWGGWRLSRTLKDRNMSVHLTFIGR